LLDQVAGRQEEIGVASDECQQACPVTLALEQLQGGKDLIGAIGGKLMIGKEAVSSAGESKQRN
jgi:hypothetical protein